MGLRETKKQKLRSAIIEKAIGLFRTSGFEATTVRQICTECEISEATFFNYFPTKGSVLGAWAHGLVEDGIRSATSGPLLDRGVRPVLRFVCSEIARSVEDDAEFAARAWRRAAMPQGPPEACELLIRRAQDSGQLRRDLGSRQMGGILYISLCGTIADWLSRAEPRGPLASELRRAADLVLDGSRRRNERVRPTSGPASRPASTR